MTDVFDCLANHIEGLVAPCGPFLNAGLILEREGETLAQAAAGRLRPDGPAPYLLESPLRFASVSKVVTARAVVALALAGKVNLDRPLADDLATPLPASVTPRSLLCHTSGLSDAAGYLIDAPETLSGFISRTLPRAYGANRRFQYSNLGFILLGALIEKAARQRFDLALQALVFDPLGIAGRFSWHGMSRAARALAGPIVRQEGASFSLQIDGAVPAEGLQDRHGNLIDLSTYVLCEHTGLFAPHAGLRMSLRDGARLAASFGDDDPLTTAQNAPLWQYDPDTNNGDAVDGLFTSYGAGVQLHPPSDWYSYPLVGHFGNAYGAACGVWADRERRASFTFMLNGMPHRRDTGEREAPYSQKERDLFKMIDRALA